MRDGENAFLGNIMRHYSAMVLQSAAKPQPETRCTTCDVQRELRNAREALEMAELEIEAMRKRVDALLAENGERLL
jgi:hypothetical protein